MTTYSGDFEEHIRDLLSNLYDYLQLSNNPVAQRLAGDLTGSARMEAIRAAVLRAIESLPAGNSPNSRQNRLYHILLLRYTEERSTGDLLQQLALSERQYYREHQRALQTISQIIWDGYFAAASGSGAARLSLAEELDYLTVDKRQRAFQPQDEILAALKATQVIAEQRGITLKLRPAPGPISLTVSQPVFRQFIIYLLNALIGATARAGSIEIALRNRAGTVLIEFQAAQLRLTAAALRARLLAEGSPRALLKRLNGELGCAGPPPRITLSFAQPRITLSFAQPRPKILIVDDNPDAVSLFQRYLANMPYQLLAARGESEALQIARRTPLLCIILDIMLPGKDGWQILQSAKSHPATAEIPVLVCSVLEMEDLALSLGADGYLRKPPARAELLAALRRWAETP